MDTIPGRKPTATRNFTNGFRHTKGRLRNDPLGPLCCEPTLEPLKRDVAPKLLPNGSIVSYHPDYFTKDHPRYIKFMHDQVRELLSSYGKISILWLDAPWYGGMFKAEDWDSEKLYRMARQLQPGILINNRSSIPGDFDTPEEHVGMFQNHRPWESCFSLATQWSWKPDDTIKPQAEKV